MVWQDLDEDRHLEEDIQDTEGEQSVPVNDEDAMFQGPQPYMRSHAPLLDTPTRRPAPVTPSDNEPKPIPISRQTQVR